jgi:transposase
MGYTSKETRWSIIAKWKEVQSPLAVAAALGIHLKVVRRWLERYLATGDVVDAQRSGRKRILDPAASQKAYRLMLSNENGNSKAVGMLLHSQGIVSKPLDRRVVARAVHNVAAEAGVKLRILRGEPKKRLSEANCQKRLAFCKSNLKRNWRAVMFSDRKKFHFTYPGQKVQPVSWVIEGGTREAAAVNHAQVVNLYAGITQWGITKLHIVAGTSTHKTVFKNKKQQPSKNITHDEYKHVVATTLLPEGRRMFNTQGLSSWVLQQDNDPTHRAAISALEAWNQKQDAHVTLLPNWPPNSPDLNPIENLWGFMSSQINARGCKTFKEYQQELHKIAKGIPLTYFTKLVQSMPKRMAACIAAGGGRTKF